MNDATAKTRPLITTPIDPADRKRTALRFAGRAAKRFDAAEHDRNNAMRFAADCGASLREIAHATGVPHVTVKRIIERTLSE